MVSKIMIEQEDKKELLQWKTERFNAFMEKVDILKADEECEYVIGIDVARECSKDKSVMMQFRIIDGRYIYEGCEEI